MSISTSPPSPTYSRREPASVAKRAGERVGSSRRNERASLNRLRMSSHSLSAAHAHRRASRAARLSASSSSSAAASASAASGAGTSARSAATLLAPRAHRAFEPSDATADAVSTSAKHCAPKLASRDTASSSSLAAAAARAARRARRKASSLQREEVPAVLCQARRDTMYTAISPYLQRGGVDCGVLPVRHALHLTNRSRP